MGHYTMLTNEEMIGLQAEKHDLIKTIDFQSTEEYILHLRLTTAYTQTARLVKNKKVLDLGCNVGYGSNILFNNAKKVVGVDVSEKAILSAKNQFGHLGIEFQKIDGKTLPYESNSFDFVVSFQVIEHIVDCNKFINEIKRITTPKGVVIFTTPNALLRLDPGMKPWNEFHIREYNQIEIQSLLNDFFINVNIFGLFAIEPLYSIEVNRVAKARENARIIKNNINNYNHHSLKAIIKRLLPQRIINFLKSLQRDDSLKAIKELKKFTGKYTVNDFFYSINNLESALDFFAVCSNDDEALDNIKAKLTK